MIQIPIDILRGLLYDECPGERANTRRYLMLDKEAANVEKARRKARKYARELIKSISKKDGEE